MAVLKPKRGEVWWINFDPSIGSEIQKCRPAVIVSNDLSNKYLDRYQAIPLTSNTDRLYPSECFVVVKGQKAKALANQIMTISQDRLNKKISLISELEILELEKAIRLQLGLF